MEEYRKILQRQLTWVKEWHKSEVVAEYPEGFILKVLLSRDTKIYFTWSGRLSIHKTSEDFAMAQEWADWASSAKMLSPSDVYAAPELQLSRSLRLLTNGWHNNLPELPEDFDPVQNRIEIKTHYDPYIDGERVCTIASAWFDDLPVMVFRCAGRGGHDEYDRFITDRTQFKKMVAFLRTLLKDEEDQEEQFNPAEALPRLTKFYGHWISL